MRTYLAQEEEKAIYQNYLEGVYGRMKILNFGARLHHRFFEMKTSRGGRAVFARLKDKVGSFDVLLFHQEVHLNPLALKRKTLNQLGRWMRKKARHE